MNNDAQMIDLTPDDLPRIKELEDTVWFEVLPGGTPEDLHDDLDFRHARGLERPGAGLPGEVASGPVPLIGIYGAFDMSVTVPGPAGGLQIVPMDGLTWVGVHPDARRRGVLTRMMTDHLHRVHDRGECAVAGLHASEPSIYGRFGYGCASLDVKLSLGRGTSLTAPTAIAEQADGVRTHIVTLSTTEGTAALHAAHVAIAGDVLGTVTRPDSKSESWFRDYPKARGSKEPRRLMLARVDDEITGYAVFRRDSKWDEGLSQGEVSVSELAARDHASLLALARRLVDLDLTTKTTIWNRSVDDPLLWWAGGPRAAGLKASDALWLRLVDVPRALAERGYASPVDVVIEVLDEVCPWNAGRWRLSVDDTGRASVEATDADADVVTPVAALGAAYLGGRTMAALAPILGVREVTPGALGLLSRAMRADTEPIGAIGF